MTTDEAARRKSLARIGAVWDISWTRDRLDAYAEALRGYQPELVERACQDAVAACKHRPVPADLVEACRTMQRRQREWERLRDQDAEFGTHAAGANPLEAA